MTHTSLIVGATGTTGRRLSQQLSTLGVEVRKGSRHPDDGTTEFDWHRPETHRAAVDGAQSVYLITPAMVEDPTPIIEPFLSIAGSAGVERIVLLSSMGVEFPNEDGTSGRHKVERALQRSGISWTILRPGGFSQNFSESFLLPMIMQADLIATATGGGGVGYVDADDIAAVAAAAMIEPDHHNTTYVLTGPRVVTGPEAAEIIGRAAGRPITFRDMSSEEFAGMLTSNGVPTDYAAAMVRNQEAIRAGWANRISGDVERVIGRSPISFEDFATRASSIWRRAS